MRGSKRKTGFNNLTVSKLEVAFRLAKKSASRENRLKAISLADKAAKKHSIHKNKAARIKSFLSRLPM